MTIDEARDRVGNKVVYCPSHVPITQQGAEGVITSVNARYVFVRYGADVGSQATDPGCLTAVSG